MMRICTKNCHNKYEKIVRKWEKEDLFCVSMYIMYIQICLNFWKIYYYISKFELNSRLDSNPSWIHYKICATILFQQYKFNHKKTEARKKSESIEKLRKHNSYPNANWKLVKKNVSIKKFVCEIVRGSEIETARVCLSMV